MTRRGASQAWAVGGLVFAASMLIMIGIWQVMVGIAAIIQDEFFVAAPNYVYNIDTTVWGWVHLSLGAISVLTGAFLFTGKTWARVFGITLAVLSAINNFIFMPYYPLWAMVVIAMDVFVIWSLATVESPAAAELPEASMSSYQHPEQAGGQTPTDIKGSPLLGR
jgi:hypothetical protein